MDTFICRQCNQSKPVSHDGGTGYSKLPNAAEDPICYSCCASLDRGNMLRNGRAMLYLSNGWVMNWPNTLSFPVREKSRGNHNITGSRTDVWFHGPDNRVWHGVQYGEWTHIVYCKRTKQAISRRA